MFDRARYESFAYATLRFVAGFMFMFHGLQKLFGVLTTKAVPEVFSQMWFGGIIELFCGVFIAVGLFTRPAAFLASGQMAVAFWQVHFHGDKPLPIQNGGELAVLYCFVFLWICVRGAGDLSIDRALQRG
jgi:putative oxidoreductase